MLQDFFRKTIAPTTDRIPPREMASAKKVNIVAGSMGTVFGVLTGGAFLTGLVQEMGATNLQVGWLAATMTLAQFVQIPSSILIEHLPRRKFYWFWTAIIHRALWWVVVLLPVFFASRMNADAVWIVILVSMLSWLLAQASAPAWLAWMGVLIPESQRGSFFGRRQAITQLATLLALLISGTLLDMFPAPSRGGNYLGYSLIFGLGTLMGCVDIIIHMAIPEPAPKTDPSSPPLGGRLLTPFRDPSFRRFLVVSGVFAFGAQTVNPFGVVYCREVLELSWSVLVSTLGTINLLAAIAGSLLWGWVVQRYGHKPVLVITILIGAINSTLWFLVSPVPIQIGIPGVWTFETPSFHFVLGAIHLIGGMTWSGYALAVFNLLLGLSPDRGRSIYTASFATVTGATGSLGAVFGGSLSQWVKHRGLTLDLIPGLSWTWWHLLVAITVVLWVITIILALKIPRPGETPSGVVLARLFASNPMRTFFHLYTLSSSKDPSRRVEAIRKLGESKTALAARDLIEALDDPNWEVRSESALSLGRIRDGAAIEALVEKLNDTKGDIRLEAARSLGKLGGKAAAEALLEHILDPSREVRLEVVRSLGRLAYHPAQAPLQGLMIQEEDSHIRAAAATALGRLRNIPALRDMIRALSVSRITKAREEIAHAIGHILFPEDRFSRMARQEERSPGAAVGAVLDRLRAFISDPTPEENGGVRILERLRASYLDEDFVAAGRSLSELTEYLVRERYRFGWENMEDLLSSLSDRDSLFEACLAYSISLKPNEKSDPLPPTRTLIVLGILFLRRAMRGIGGQSHSGPRPEAQ